MYKKKQQEVHGVAPTHLLLSDYNARISVL